ncbi:MAG: DUF262 domain-containing protein [Micropruina sp.]|uniref:GmrSD restriction endonuclease domain-containing protein n=1 Tax=Micropruina sp. TaxID=2737536 RepID=UPI0039E7054C
MPIMLFKDTTYQLNGLIEDIRRGEVALPDIQRPFVWQASRIRDLFDSMYQGFPVGYLLFWATGAPVGARQIGTVEKEAVPRLLVVDGQQRLTSLYAVLAGQPVLKSDYSTARISIGFRPSDAHFVVTSAATREDPEYIADITTLWNGKGRRQVVRDFFARLEQKRTLEKEEQDRLDDAIDRLFDLQNYPFKVIELSADVDEEQVAEVFVRINSEGVKLNRADFILTLMSVHWERGRLELEQFCRSAKNPAASGPSPFNWFIKPQPDQLLRVGIALGTKRAVLQQAYTLLRGKDLKTGIASAEAQRSQFQRLEAAQSHVLNLTNWHEFLQCLERAGYRSAAMITSDNAVLYSYAMWLIGRVDYRMPIAELRDVITRWFFMAHATSRYSGSFETQFESDVAKLDSITTAAGFTATLDQVVNDTLTSDFWTITLPNSLATSASKSPALSAYIAALNILDADALLGKVKVRSRLDPAIAAKKGVERHHIFPKAYLKRHLGLTDIKQVNQIANMALVDWPENIGISDQPPTEYWPTFAARLDAHVLARQMHHHALPEGWTELSFSEFLVARRSLMAQVVREAFDQLRSSRYVAQYPHSARPSTDDQAGLPDEKRRMSVAELLEAGSLQLGAVLMPADNSLDALATVLEDGRLDIDGRLYESPDHAAIAVTGAESDGWRFWLADTPEGPRPLIELEAIVG